MSTTNRFDGHCHFFNVYFLIRESVAIGWDWIWGNYPRGAKDGAADAGDNGSQESILELIKEFLCQVVQVAKSLGGSYNDNYNLLCGAYQEVYGKEDQLFAIPLMMDIYYMFAPPPGMKDSAQSTRGFKKGHDPKQEFDKWFDELKKLLHDRISEKDTALENDFFDQMDDIYENITGQQESITSGQKSDTVMTPGYRTDIENCIEFAIIQRGKVYPFLAIDPRRGNIMQLVQDGSSFGVQGPLVTKQGPFYGIKLYPRLGYLPKDVDNIGLLAWCHDNDIPITFHCDLGGFPPLFNKWDDYGDPGQWQDVLKKYMGAPYGKGLRINFAHFGKTKDTWREKILEYINHPDIYGNKIFTDVACYSDINMFYAALATYTDPANELLRGKLLFGTDYDVMLLTKLPIDNKHYFMNYNQVFASKSDLTYTKEMMEDAPRAFLGLAES